MPNDYIDEMEKLVREALRRKNDTLLTITSRCGWHGKSFVDWYQTYGPEADLLIFDWRQWPGTCRAGKFKKLGAQDLACMQRIVVYNLWA